MINRLKQSLRLAALEDLLHYQLGLSQNTSAGLARLAWETRPEWAGGLQGSTNEQLRESFFIAMYHRGNAGVVDRAAAESPAFRAALDQFIASESLPDQLAA